MKLSQSIDNMKTDSTVVKCRTVNRQITDSRHNFRKILHKLYNVFTGGPLVRVFKTKSVLQLIAIYSQYLIAVNQLDHLVTTIIALYRTINCN